MHGLRQLALVAVSVFGASCIVPGALAQSEYRPIKPTMADKTITLTGRNLTIDQLVQIARYGAKVKVSPEAMQRAADSFGLMLEAQAEGISVYRFNRAAGQGREIVTMTGDPDTPENKAKLAARHSPQGNGGGGAGGLGPEIPDEDVSRAMLAVIANIVTYEAASPGYVQGVVDLLNSDVTPPINWRGARGEADFVPVAATMQGRGYAYYKGVRMLASEALQKAGLKAVQLEGNDEALNTTSALTAGEAALMVSDSHQLLQWADLIYAMVLNGMNSSVTPMSMPVQAIRPFPWVNYTSARVMDMIKGGYLFNDDKARIIQDPESMRATPWRQGGVWEAWASLRDSTLIQMNSSDHNPTVRPNVSPEDSWELSTPQMMKYYVKGGKYSNGKHGFIFSNSNWDPYPLANKVEAFTAALANLDVIIVQTVNRFTDPFFTVVKPQDILNPQGTPSPMGGPAFGGGPGGGSVSGLWQEIKTFINPVAPDGVWSGSGVGDVDAVPLLKLDRARQAVNANFELFAEDLQTAAFWMDVRKVQDPSRTFGQAPTAAWVAFRKVVPLRRDPAAAAPEQSNGELTVVFLKATPAATFYPGGPAMPGGEGQIPIAEPKKMAKK